MGVLIDVTKNFMASNPRRANWLQAHLSEDLAERLGQKRALERFRVASSSIPAYQAHLKAHDVDVSGIKDFASFTSVPTIDKRSYLLPNRTHFERLAIGGGLGTCHTVSRTSGSSGEPIYWPRNAEQEVSTVMGMHALWVDAFGIDTRSTLVIDCFDLGMWTGGEFAADMARQIARKSKGMLMVATPGSDIDETVRVVLDLGHRFDQLLPSRAIPRSSRSSWTAGKRRVSTGGAFASA